MPVWAWILIGLVVLIPAFLLSPFVAVAALIVLVTAVVGLAKGTRTWLRFPTRRAAATVTAAAAVAVLVFGGVAAAGQAGRTDQPVEAQRFADLGAPTAEPTDSAEVKTDPAPTLVTTIREEVVKEAVPFATSSVDDASMAQGTTAVSTAGIPGEKTLTYRVTLVDGVETQRELISEVVTIQPVTEVTSVGTYVAPPPPEPAPAQPAGCDSNYSEACVPVSSDVDCAWGSGDGPAYFDGVARVVGTDKYDLDRDGDGWACER